MSEKIKNLEENFHMVIYNLIYPALLGSMLYAMFPYGISIYPNDIGIPRYLFNLGIVIFYLLDYYHQFTFFSKKFPEKIRPLQLQPIDLGVSLILWFSFHVKYYCISFGLLCLLPFLFTSYPKYFELKYHGIPVIYFHIAYGVISIFLAVISYFCIRPLSEYYPLLLISSMIILYRILMKIEKDSIPHKNILSK